MPSVKELDPDRISVAVGGAIMSGFAPDSIVEIEQETEDFGDEVGADGGVTRYKTTDKRATVRIYLMSTSDSNDLLSAINNADRKATNGAGIVSIQIRDQNGRSLYNAAEAWIKKPPTVSFKRGVQERVWELRCANLERFDGGN
jgi:hypothetical protein